MKNLIVKERKCCNCICYTNKFIPYCDLIKQYLEEDEGYKCDTYKRKWYKFGEAK